MSELLLIEQRRGEHDEDGNGAPYILDRHGNMMEGRDDERRTSELRSGLTEHPGVTSSVANCPAKDVERILSVLHDREYLRALRAVDSKEPTMMPEWAPPGLPADSPVWAGVVATAFEGARTAVTAADRIAEGARFAYALCRPPATTRAPPGWAATAI